MTTRVDTRERSLRTGLLGALVAFGVLRVAARFYGFLALLGIVLGTVLAFAVLILVLHVLVQH